MTFSANPFDMTGVLDTSGYGLASGASALPKIGSITGATVSSGVVTFTVADTSEIFMGQPIVVDGITGFTTNNPNGSFVVNTIPSATTFTAIPFTVPTGTYTSGGTLYYGSDPGNASVASATTAFTDATLVADAANRVRNPQIPSPYLSWN